MNKILIAIIVFCTLGVTALHAQSEYAVFQGPSHFMRLNEAGDDFVEVDINENKGSYTFYHSYLDIKNPWSVVSEEGTNIYTKLNFNYVTDFKDLFLLTPALELSSSSEYTFSQSVFGIANETEAPGAIVQVELQLLEGEPKDFDPEMLSGKSSLKAVPLRETALADITVEGLVPENTGSHYFVLYVTYLGYFPGNTTAMSLGFKKNEVTRLYGTGLSDITSDLIEVYPNPSPNYITIRGLEGGLSILNILGNRVMSLDNYSGQQLDISELEAGVYLIKGESGVIRFVKR